MSDLKQNKKRTLFKPSRAIQERCSPRNIFIFRSGHSSAVAEFVREGRDRHDVIFLLTTRCRKLLRIKKIPTK